MMRGCITELIFNSMASIMRVSVDYDDLEYESKII